MTDDEMFGVITAQRLRLINRLEALDAAQWEASSLCSGWRVRDVTGHLVSILDIPVGRFILGAVKARNFDRYADRVAREYGGQDPSALAARYRGLASKRFAPPMIGPIAPLVDLYVHARDIERPLGFGPDLDPAGLPTVLDHVCGGRARGFVPASRTAGLRFSAPDLGWAQGDGPLIEGPAEAVMMAVNGRSVALADLNGDGTVELGRRLAA